MPLISPDRILSFWADAGPGKWWTKDHAFDTLIRNQFGDLHRKIAEGENDSWETVSPDAALSLVIVLDQFSRHIYRGRPRAYACDDKAVNVVHRVIARGEDRHMRSDVREFIYMPLMHSESLEDQNLSVAETARWLSAEDLASAEGHRDIIARFGRFPHRNEILGRSSTPEEISFLQKGGFAG